MISLPVYQQIYPKEIRKKLRCQNNTHKKRANWAGVECAFSNSDWMHAISAFNGCCAYCGIGLAIAENAPNSLSVEHVLPICFGGGHVKSNVVPACQSCNNRRYTKQLDMWLLATFGVLGISVYEDVMAYLGGVQ